MDVVEVFSSASMFTQIALPLITVTNLFNYIAFTTSSWGIAEVTGGDNYYTGLWRRCRTKTPGCDFLDGYAKEWFGATQGFACVGFAGVNVVFVLIVCYVFWNRCQRDREVCLSAGFIALITAVCWLIAVIIFGVRYEGDNDVSTTVSPNEDMLGFSFVMAVFTFVMECAVGVLMFVECFHKRGAKGTVPTSIRKQPL